METIEQFIKYQTNSTLWEFVYEWETNKTENSSEYLLEKYNIGYKDFVFEVFKELAYRGVPKNLYESNT